MIGIVLYVLRAHFGNRAEVFDVEVIQINDILAKQPDDDVDLNSKELSSETAANRSVSKQLVKNVQYQPLCADTSLLVRENDTHTLSAPCAESCIYKVTRGKPMKKLLSAGLLVIVIAPGTVALSQTRSDSVSAQTSEQGSKATIEGLVRDIACPIQNHEATATNLSMKCLRDCVKAGSPLAILTKDGDLYLPISNKMPDTDQRQRLLPFAGKYVRASGTVFERNGTHAIAIEKLEEVKSVHLHIVD